MYRKNYLILTLFLLISCTDEKRDEVVKVSIARKAKINGHNIISITPTREVDLRGGDFMGEYSIIGTDSLRDTINYSYFIFLTKSKTGEWQERKDN